MTTKTQNEIAELRELADTMQHMGGGGGPLALDVVTRANIRKTCAPIRELAARIEKDALVAHEKLFAFPRLCSINANRDDLASVLGVMLEPPQSNMATVEVLELEKAPDAPTGALVSVAAQFVRLYPPGTDPSVASQELFGKEQP